MLLFSSPLSLELHSFKASQVQINSTSVVVTNPPPHQRQFLAAIPNQDAHLVLCRRPIAWISGLGVTVPRAWHWPGRAMTLWAEAGRWPQPFLHHHRDINAGPGKPSVFHRVSPRTITLPGCLFQRACFACVHRCLVLLSLNSPHVSLFTTSTESVFAWTRGACYLDRRCK